MTEQPASAPRASSELELESAARDLGRAWAKPADGVRRLDLVRAFARGVGWELYFDAQGQAVLHSGLYLQHDGDIAPIAAPCVRSDA